MTQEEIITSACDAYREGKQDLVGVVIATQYRTIALVVIELMDMLRKEKIRTDCTNEYVVYKLIQTLREKANTIKPNVYE